MRGRQRDRERKRGRGRQREWKWKKKWKRKRKRKWGGIVRRRGREVSKLRLYDIYHISNADQSQ